MVNFFSPLNNLRNKPALLSFLFTSTLIVILCLAFDPRWETNDDVAMSMVAHGYGLAAYGSPHLIFSNVLWGYLVRGIPTIHGVLGYSVATMAVLLVVGWTILYFLLRLGAGYLFSVLTVALVIARPTLFPQFTINAGLLAVAAVIGWRVHARLGGIGSLIVACLLAFFSYLIRSQEFLLVLGVALPFLPWGALRERWQMQAAFLLLIVAIASAAALDRWSYSGPEWQHFLELNPARAPFTDFGAGEYLKQRPDIMTRHGYTQNDIDLIRHWFFVDPKIADPNSLNTMLAELGPLPMQEGSVKSGFSAIKTLIVPTLLPLLLTTLFLFAMSPRWSVAFAWALCLAALFAMGMMGRPGVLRVYVPLVTLLLVAPLLIGQLKLGVQRWIAILTLFLACIGNAYLLIPEALAFKQETQQVQRDVKSLPAEPIVCWGSGFPFESAFPVLANDPTPHHIKLYSLGVFTQAPFSVATAEVKAGHGMIELLRSVQGVPIIATKQKIELLSSYCGEQLNGQLQLVATHETPSMTIQQVRCEATK